MTAADGSAHHSMEKSPDSMEKSSAFLSGNGSHNLVTGLSVLVHMTTAEMLRAEGEARGEARGLAKALVHMLTVKFGPLPDDVLQKVHAAASSQVEAWTERAVTAETLNQVFH